MSHTPSTPLLIRIDPRAPGTLQRQIYAGIRRSILDGVLAAGARLPSSRALAADLGVSRTTMLLALEQLLAEGYLTAQRGSGTFVAGELPEAPAWPARGRPPAHPSLSRRGEALAANPRAAHRVGRPPRPFRLGVPALNLFPVKIWARLAARRLRSVSEAQLDYGEVAGMRELREAIAAHVQTARGTQCSADQVLVVSGSKPGLDLICRLLLDAGDRVWIEDPGYPGARGALLAAGARLVPVRVDAEGLDVEDGARRAPRARLAYVTPSHQFPLGVPMSLPRRLALLSWAARARAWIVEDDYDSEFRHGAHPEPCLHGLDSDGRVVYVGSFSKTLFPALRLGFLIVPSDLHDRLVDARRALDHHPPVLLQSVLADFIAGGHFARHLHRMRAVYRERLEALAAAARRHCAGALRLRPTRTGLHAVADLSGVDDESVFHEAAARGVEVMPLSTYYLRRGGAENGLVLGFAAARPEALERGMEKLAAAIEASVRGSRARRAPR